jgi:MFS family permease
MPRLAVERPREAHSGRPLRVILRQPAAVVATSGAAIGYGVMILAMTAAPLAMVQHHHPVETAAFAIQAHVLGLFAPSFFTGVLIQRFGVLRVMAAGMLLLAGHVAIAVSGTEWLQFVSALVLLGVGWNFLYIGGTTLLTEAHRPEERARTQAANDLIVFGVVAAAPRSLSAGSCITSAGRR